MERKSRIGLLVAGCAAAAAIAGLVVYSNVAEERLRPATQEEVAIHLQGEWNGVAVDSWNQHWTVFKTYGPLQNNRFEGSGRWQGSSCPNRAIAGLVEGNRISEVITYTDVPKGAPSFCGRQSHEKYEMKIGEDGALHLVGTWDAGEYRGTVELTKAR